MRLNHIEISGFKSFPERSELAFDGGVTAIVGPNGCGKSNLIDAISWVLGEQSARSLRGERMEDIIFSGSDGRRPTATAEVRLQLSQVTDALAGLTETLKMEPQNGNGHLVSAEIAGLHNGEDHAESNRGDAEQGERDIIVSGCDETMATVLKDVEVGRRLFRSGESEYLIDGHVCRLRDIQDLLMDSGVGVKAYAVIEQGKIGQILSARPMERRQLLEEAAGVTKYKTRRRSAELKLEAAQKNLTRVDDIVFEVEKQRSALKRQAAKARRYRRLRETLRRWEKIQFAQKNVSFTHAIESARQRLDTVRQREESSKRELKAIEDKHEHLQVDLTQADHSVAQARDAAHAQELELGRRKQQIESDKSQVSSLANSVVLGKEDLRQLDKRNTPLQEEFAKQWLAADECDAARNTAATDLEKLEASYAEALKIIEGLESDVEASRSEVFAAVNSATTLRHVVENSSLSRSRLADELAKLERELSDFVTELEAATSTRTRAGNSTAQVKSSLEAIRQNRGVREAELVAVRSEVESGNHRVRLGEQSLASLLARLRSIEELVAAREGYSDGARLVLSLSKSEVQHFGSIADHLEVDHGYERAVEASLDELIQYVIVPSANEVKKGLEFVQNRNVGRCGFVVADAIEQVLPDKRKPYSALLPLIDVVKVDGIAKQAIRGLFVNRWLAPSFAEAAEAAKITTDSISTPDGTVFCGSSIIRWGGKTEVRGILATKGEIRDLQSKIEIQEDTLTRLRDDLTRQSGRATAAEADLKALEKEEHITEKELLELELGLKRVGEELIRLHQKQSVLKTERRKAKEEFDNLEARESEANQAIIKLESEQRVADERFMSSQRDLMEAREAVELRGHKLTEAKAEYAALVERAAAFNSDVKRIDDALVELSERLVSEQEAIERKSERHGILSAEIVTSQAALQTGVEQFELLQKDVQICDQRTTDIRRQIEDQTGKLRAAREALNVVQEDVGRLSLARATAEADLAGLQESCNEVLQLSLEEVCREVEGFDIDNKTEVVFGVNGSVKLSDPEISVDKEGIQAEKETDDDGSVCDEAEQSLEPVQMIAELRQKIEQLGPVNMMAIDQFDELEDRFEFLTTQRKDLLDSILATGEAIKRIDVTTRERFKEAFSAVNDYFQEIFSTLFGGGRAGLVLIDETDVLESGIDIIAQPPGKRLQSIQLLSGGEKALTAMALMFAIFKFKPSPFCLLDEIDAPLDDANIGRFVTMLRGMQDRTQFVLVTHNRKTMEIADRLYGVTMEEPGVSKLISVRLD
tara:strand:- start:7201 stop:11028 length:3828 start_codon:yes stop_codon:yes gene_type:complete